MVANVADSSLIPKVEKAYLEFARRKGFSEAIGAEGRPLLKETKLFLGFQDAFDKNPRKQFDKNSRAGLDQFEYNTGYDGGMFAGFAGEDYFRQPYLRDVDELFRRLIAEDVIL
ncbi:hypothetical protein HYV80_07095 [Candidatus Woesearchaeota archaeon]|nr:hypothetical protein [Candidatus Woesearchaeota archaeon]